MNNNTSVNLCIGKNIQISFPKDAIMSENVRSIYAFSERNLIYRAINTNKKVGLRLQIDGKLYSHDTKKCDYGLLVEDGRFFLIELKGKCDICHACEQLIATSTKLKQDYKNYKFDFFYRIVAERCFTPQMSTKEQIYKRILGKDKFKIQKNILEEDI